jgi:hypothetical protein
MRRLRPRSAGKGAGGRRFVLLADGSIEDHAEGELKRRVDKSIAK